MQITHWLQVMFVVQRLMNCKHWCFRLVLNMCGSHFTSIFNADARSFGVYCWLANSFQCISSIKYWYLIDLEVFIAGWRKNMTHCPKKKQKTNFVPNIYVWCERVFRPAVVYDMVIISQITMGRWQIKMPNNLDST